MGRIVITMRFLRIKYLLIPVFLAVIMSPSVIIVDFYVKSYNRPLTWNTVLYEFPLWLVRSPQAPVKRSEGFSEFTDRIPLKNKITLTYAEVLYKMKASAYPQSVRVGQEGHLFLGDKYERVYSDAKGILDVSDDQLNNVYNALVCLQQWYERRGIRFYFLCAPNHHTIYPEYLPCQGIKKLPTCYDRFLEIHQKQQKLHLVNVREQLLEGKKKYPDLLYFKADSHWNELGAQIGYEGLMQYIGRDMPVHTLQMSGYRVKPGKTIFMKILAPYDAISLEFTNFSADKLTYDNFLTRKETVIDPRKPFLLAEPGRWIDKAGVFVNSKSLNPYRVMIYRDSFYDGLAEKVTQTFSRVFATHYAQMFSGEYNYQKIARQLKFDIAIFEIVERSLPFTLVPKASPEFDESESALAWEKLKGPQQALVFLPMEKEDKFNSADKVEETATPSAECGRTFQTVMNPSRHGSALFKLEIETEEPAELQISHRSLDSAEGAGDAHTPKKVTIPAGVSTVFFEIWEEQMPKQMSVGIAGAKKKLKVISLLTKECPRDFSLGFPAENRAYREK